jgi:NAD(P)-dependent dehydrogenase (short-subunit alcohol dehydrogenase family)
VILVTGGASGIGRALCEAFAAAGAKGVVVCDVDEAGAQAVAAQLGAQALGLHCDVTDQAQVAASIDAAEREFGAVDLYCANAGIGTGTDEQTPDDMWDLALQVNTMAHVYAARELVPRWLERGGGYFLSTASAAGLLTQIGSAPYAVTKHAAVAFAEWLSVTYGERGIKVSCLCPMAVDTPLLHAGENSGDPMGATATAVVKAAGAVLTPQECAQIVLAGLAQEHFLILPHPEVLEFYRRKGSDYDRWLAGMRRLQAMVSGG